MNALFCFSLFVIWHLLCLFLYFISLIGSVAFESVHFVKLFILCHDNKNKSPDSCFCYSFLPVRSNWHTLTHKLYYAYKSILYLYPYEEELQRMKDIVSPKVPRKQTGSLESRQNCYNREINRMKAYTNLLKL